MSGIYSSPVQYPTQPENAMRAIKGERPLCWNRPDFPELQTVQKGLRLYEEPRPCCGDGWGIEDTFFVPVFDEVWNGMSKDCKSWSVHPAEDPATESVPGRESWRCWGCRHLPQDPRVISRAKQAETK